MTEGTSMDRRTLLTLGAAGLGLAALALVPLSGSRALAQDLFGVLTLLILALN